jgi:hypothetical protein
MRRAYWERQKLEGIKLSLFPEFSVSFPGTLACKVTQSVWWIGVAAIFSATFDDWLTLVDS